MSLEPKTVNLDQKRLLGEEPVDLETLNKPNEVPFPGKKDMSVPMPEQVASIYNHQNLQEPGAGTGGGGQPSYFPQEDSAASAMPSFFPVDQMDERPTLSIADIRAKRYDYALDKDSPGHEQIYNDIATGSEDQSRLRASMKEKTNLNVKRASMIQRFIGQMGPGGVTAEQLAELQKADAAEVAAANQDPKTYFERKFAQKSAVDSTADIAAGGHEDKVAPIISFSNDVRTNQQTARKFFEDATSKMEDRTYPQAAKEWIPFYRWIKLGTAFDDPSEAGGYMLGSNMKSQIEAAYRLPPDEFYKTQSAVMKKLTESDPGLAAEYASALLGYTVGSKFMDNAATWLDTSVMTPATLMSLGKLSIKGAAAAIRSPGDYISNLKLIQAANTMKGITKSLAGPEVDYIALLPQARQAQAAAVDSIRRKALATGQVADWDALAGTIQPIINPQTVLTGAKNMTTEEAARLEVGMLRTSATALNELISRPRSLERLSPEELSAATSEATTFVEKMYNKSTLGSRIVSIKANTIEAGENLANTDAIAVYLGSAKATGFASEPAAKTAGTKMGLNKFTTEEINGQHYIKLVHYVDETSTLMRAYARSNDKYLDTPRNGYAQGIMSRVRMRDSLIPQQLAEDFKFAQAGTNQYFENVRSRFVEDFEGLPKGQRKDLDMYLESQRDFREQNGPSNDPASVTRGQEDGTVGQFERNYAKMHQRLPNFNETKAYFAWKQWNDVDYAIRNLDLTRDMNRLGVQSHEFMYRLPGGTQIFYTPKLEGKVLLKFPWDRRGDAGIIEWDAAEPWRSNKFRKAFIKDDAAKPTTITSETQDATNKGQVRYGGMSEREYIDDLIENKGYKVVHLTPWAKKGLRDTMSAWTGFSDEGGAAMGGTPVATPPTPLSPRQKALTKRQQELADIETRRVGYADKARDSSGTDKLFHDRMALDPMFRASVERRGMPTTEAGQMNELLDHYSKSAAAGGQGAPEYVAKIQDMQEKLGRPIQDSDLMTRKAVGESATETRTELRQDYADTLSNIRAKAETKYNMSKAAAEEPNAYHQFAEEVSKLPENVRNRYQVHGMVAVGPAGESIDRNLINLLEDGINPNQTLHSGPPIGGTNGVDSTRTYGAPYLLISDPDKTLAETGVKHVVLQGAPGVGIKGELERQYPHVDFMTTKEAAKYMRNGMTESQRSLEQAAAATVAEADRNEFNAIHKYHETSHGMGIGEEVYITDNDGNIIQKNKKNILGFEQTKELGPVAYVEGTDSAVPISNLYKTIQEATQGSNMSIAKIQLEEVRNWAKTIGNDVKVRSTLGSNKFTLIEESPTNPGQTNILLNGGSLQDLEKMGFKDTIKGPGKPTLIKNPDYKPNMHAEWDDKNPAGFAARQDNEAPGLSKRELAAEADVKKRLDPGSFDYILIKPDTDMRTSPLDFIRFPHQEGGHSIMSDDWLVRQADIYTHTVNKSTIHTYEGDKNAYSAVVEKDARDFASHLENIRAKLKDDLASGANDAEAYYTWLLQDTSKDFKSFKNQFKEFHPDGQLSVEHPFVVTPRDRSSWDYISALKDNDGNPRYPNLENQRDGEHNLFNNELNLQFALQRNDKIESVVRNGTPDAPTFGTAPQGNLSPMATMINTMNGLVKGRIIDDLKIKTAENFGKNFAEVIDAPLQDIRKDPMYYILNPKWKTGMKGENLTMLSAAKDYRRAIIDFMGVEDPMREAILTAQRKAAESIKSRLGQGSYEWVDRHLLRSGTINPVRWANNVVLDLFFGAFNIKQIAVQGMTAFHTVAVLGPKTGLQAGSAAWLMRPLLYHEIEERTAFMAAGAAKIGIKPEYFRELLTSYKRSGWHLIGGETAIQDDFINQSIKPSFVERSRAMGRVMFKEGDRYTRSTAYAGAYLEWREAHPGAALTPRIEKEILNRADTLSLNMTAASNAAIAKGAAAIPLKFTTYYLRMMEHMLPGYTSGPLTAKEKMRAYAAYSVAFGAPITASGTFGLWPIHKEISKILMERGYDTDENKVLKFFNEGLAGTLPSLIGPSHNFSEALGPSGTSWLYDIWNGRSPIFDVVTGVAGTKISDTYDNAWPFFTFMANAFRGDDKKYPLAWEDLEMLARSVSSVNNVWKAAQMHNLGVYMTKNRTPLMQGVGDTDALYSLMFGTEPSAVQKAFLQTDMTRSTQLMKDAARKDIMKYHRLQNKAVVEDDLEAAVHYGKVLKYLVAANGFTPDEFNRLFSDAVTTNGDLVHQAQKKFDQSTPARQQQYLKRITPKADQQPDAQEGEQP